MATLRPPAPAFREGRNGRHLDPVGSARLSTRVPRYLRRRGFIPSWPAPGEVFGVDGVPSDATVPNGILIAQNTRTKTLYRKTADGWQSVNGVA